jgi:hypothetical protein
MHRNQAPRCTSRSQQPTHRIPHQPGRVAPEPPGHRLEHRLMGRAGTTARPRLDEPPAAVSAPGEVGRHQPRAERLGDLSGQSTQLGQVGRRWREAFRCRWWNDQANGTPSTTQVRTSWATGPYRPSPADTSSSHSRARTTASQPRARRNADDSSSSSAGVSTREMRPPFFHEDSAVRTKSGNVRSPGSGASSGRTQVRGVGPPPPARSRAFSTESNRSSGSRSCGRSRTSGRLATRPR